MAGWVFMAPGSYTRPRRVGRRREVSGFRIRKEVSASRSHVRPPLFALSSPLCALRSWLCALRSVLFALRSRLPLTAAPASRPCSGPSSGPSRGRRRGCGRRGRCGCP
ncbi:MAG: hypothetical protein FJ221_11840 [Lentisphaerae bacterium]|nr:hypothetical protein [Lentisphaerota bacterium]